MHEQLETDQRGGRKPALGALAEEASVSWSKSCCCRTQGAAELWDLIPPAGTECEICPSKGTAVIHNCILSIPTWTKGSLVTYLLHPALPQQLLKDLHLV